MKNKHANCSFAILLAYVTLYPVWLHAATAATDHQQYTFTKDMAGYTRVHPDDVYQSNHPYGYDFGTKPAPHKPFYFSVKATEGNYRVILKVTALSDDARFTVKAESRRLLLLQEPLKKGEQATRTFIVNIKDRAIAGGGIVKLKSREFGKLDWDDKLTIELDAQQVELEQLTLEKLTTAAVPTLFLAGNSTVVNQDNEPWGSWGQMIPAFFTAQVAVANHAESGLTLGSFRGSKRLDKVLSIMQPNDYLFIEFGHNDQKEKGPKDGAYGSYTERLRFFVKAVREKGGIPVIVTPTNRRTFNEQGKIYNSLGDYPEAARKVAADLQVPLIDLNEMTKTLYEAWGPEDSKKGFVHYPAHTYPGQDQALKDNTHFNTYGAFEIARCVLEGIRQHVPALRPYMKKTVPTFNPAQPDAISSWNWPESPRADITKPDGN